MYFISEDCYELISAFVNKTTLDLKADSLGNLYFKVNQFNINEINFIFGKQSLDFLMGILFGSLYKLELSDIYEVEIDPNDVNEFKLRNICLNSPVIEMSDALGMAYISLIKSFYKVKNISINEIYGAKYEPDFLNLLSDFLIFCGYWNLGKVKVIKNIEDSDYVYLCRKNLKCAFKYGSMAVSKIKGNK